MASVTAPTLALPLSQCLLYGSPTSAFLSQSYPLLHFFGHLRHPFHPLCLHPFRYLFKAPNTLSFLSSNFPVIVIISLVVYCHSFNIILFYNYFFFLMQFIFCSPHPLLQRFIVTSPPSWPSSFSTPGPPRCVPAVYPGGGERVYQPGAWSRYTPLPRVLSHHQTVVEPRHFFVFVFFWSCRLFSGRM